ncbi:MAG: fused MFS/spermidine synthase [Pirellulaceae bacterium]
MVPFNIIFFLSGFAALVYEVSWNRQLGLLFGHTSHAAAVVLAAYFGGMAIGYAVGGRIANRICPYRGYAACELIVAVWAFAIPFGVVWANSDTLAPWLQAQDARIQIMSRVAFSLMLLAPATIALGATLPMMSEMLARKAAQSALHNHRESLTRAYGFNLLGAVCGVVAASSMMLAVVGVTGSSQLAAIISASCAVGALLLRSTSIGELNCVSQRSVEFPTARSPLHIRTKSQADGRYWMTAVAVSGGATLALEVLYTRLFSLIFHNSTYTFSFVLIGFLLGMSLGAFAARRLLCRFSPTTLVSWASVCAAFAVSVSVLAFVFGTRLEYFQAGKTFASYYAGGLLLSMVVTLPVATFAGAFLPLAWAARSIEDNLSSGNVGGLTLVNTVAAAIGAVAASFVFFPLAGLWRSFALVAALLLVPAIWQALRTESKRLHAFAVLGTVILCLPLALANPEIWVRGDQSGTLLHRWHSSYGWIDVVEDAKTGVKKIQQNLHYRYGATGANSEREFRQAHLPLLLHDSPRDVLFLGLGTGMTAGGAMPHCELETIEIVELIPEVVPAVRMLADENRNVVDDPRTRMIVDDARHFLVTTQKQYDVIVSDLFVPWESETGYLYTVEQFRTARTRLSEGGIFCQWLPLYQLGPDDFEMIADSLRSVFPHVTLWWGKLESARPIMALVATENPITINEAAMQRRLHRLSLTGQFDDSSLSTPTRLVELYAGDWPLRLEAKLNTDEHPWVEFHCPVSNRSGSGIRGVNLRDFLSQILETTATDSLRYVQSAGSTPPSERSWQRTVIFPEPIALNK